MIKINPIADYTNEKNLGDLLRILFPKEEIKYNSKYTCTHNPKISFKPDYYLPNLKLIVEFDGPVHYTRPSVIIRDKEKTKWCKLDGVNLIRIPYFIQMSQSMIISYFQEYFEHHIINHSFTTFPHGFITTEILPANFCPLGVSRFNEDIHWLLTNERENEVEDIFASLMYKLSNRDFLDVFAYGMDTDAIKYFANKYNKSISLEELGAIAPKIETKTNTKIIRLTPEVYDQAKSILHGQTIMVQINKLNQIAYALDDLISNKEFFLWVDENQYREDFFEEILHWTIMREFDSYYECWSYDDRYIFDDISGDLIKINGSIDQSTWPKIIEATQIDQIFEVRLRTIPEI